MTLATSPAIDAAPLTLGRVIVLVHDYDAALDFYCTAFGARVLFDAPSPLGGRYLHVGFGGDPGAGIWLLQVGGSDMERVGRQTGGEPVAVFYASDVAAAVARVEAAGGAIIRPVETADGARFAHVADLYGNVFVLVELPPAAS
jgi:predicted enzyme related to lactoylglutathione lyase